MMRSNLHLTFGRAVRTAILLTTLLVGGAPALAETQDGGWPGDWLSGYRSARAGGLGGAFTAVADDPVGMAWNPAGMTQLQLNGLHVERSQLFEGTAVSGLSFVVPGTRYPTFGVTVLTLGSGDFQRTNDLNDPQGAFQDKQTAFLLSASHDVLPFLALGANLRIVHQSLDDYSASGHGFDLGLLARPTADLRLGLSVANLGGPSLTLRDAEETYPRQLRAGAALQLMEGRALVTADVVGVQDADAGLHGGAEFWLIPELALRAGFDGDAVAGGFSYRMPGDLRLDYGAIGHELGVTHRFGLSWGFGGFFARAQADPETFSPLGSRSTTRFDLSSRTRDEAARWRLAIVDKFERTVRSFGGQGTPPAHVMWDGKDDAGTPLPDGAYRYRLTVHDAGGRTTEGPARAVVIDTGLPRVSVPIQIGRSEPAPAGGTAPNDNRKAD